MSDPRTLAVEVVNAVGTPIPGATAVVTIERIRDATAREWIESMPEAQAPLSRPLRTGFTHVTVRAAAPGYYPEFDVVTLGGGDLRWTGNPAWALREYAETGHVSLRVPLGRLRFAPIVELSPDDVVKTPFNPGGIWVTPAAELAYALPSYESRKVLRCRALRAPATRHPSADDWDRFNWDEREIQLSAHGNWLVLEYGDPPPGTLRHLVGVWAPPSFPGTVPPVVVHLTPDPAAPDFPADGLPFTGVYPYGMVPKAEAKPDKSGSMRISDCRQIYADGPWIVTRTALLQMYAARADIFDTVHGPIVITPSPAMLRTGAVLREPFVYPDATGRLIAEVLRFLWAKQQTRDMAVGSVRLGAMPPEVTRTIARPPAAPEGFPAHSHTTLLCAATAVGPALKLAGASSRDPLPRGFPPALFGGVSEHCDRDWVNLWVIDGVSNPGSLHSPKVGSKAAATWLEWLRRHDRRTMVAVYTPTGLDDDQQPGIIKNVKRYSGDAGWIEEGFDANVRWLRLDQQYLRVEDPSASSNVVPPFGSDGPSVFDFGVGYAARRPP